MKRKKRFRDYSLKTSFVIYTLTMFCAATLVCSVAISRLDELRRSNAASYWSQYEEYEIPAGGSYVSWADEKGFHYQIYDDRGELTDTVGADGVTARISLLYMKEPTEGEDGGAVSGVVEVEPVWSEEERAYDLLLGMASAAVFPVCYGGGAVLCAFLFYRKKLRTPIAVLRDASRKIARKELDFSIRWDRNDEMGRLCASFEQMRAALERGNRELWRQMEERKRLNAAFAHDLRTPLTVLKGHAAMLLQDLSSGGATREEMADEVRVMDAHIARMEAYVNAMNGLQRLEDIEIHPKPGSAEALAGGLRDCAQILCAGKRLEFHFGDIDEPLCVDREIVMQVFENLLSNAVRYAREEVRVLAETRDGFLILRVSDDGPGFKAVQKATEPFYRGEGRGGDGHLGLGLYICQILCKRHGGGVSVTNNPGGGCSVGAAFALGEGITGRAVFREGVLSNQTP